MTDFFSRVLLASMTDHDSPAFSADLAQVLYEAHRILRNHDLDIVFSLSRALEQADHFLREET